jgi:hypothetical protein
MRQESKMSSRKRTRISLPETECLSQSAALIETQASGHTPIIGPTIAADRRKLDPTCKET